MQKENTDKTDFLTIYGLWSSLPRSIAARGVNNRRWVHFGCATYPIPNLFEARASRKCVTPKTGLSLESTTRLSAVMPDAGGRSCLERYEYAEHGAYFGLGPDAYFGTVVRLNNKVKNGEAGKFLVESYGKTVSRNAFNTTVAKSWGRGNIKAVKLNCHGNPAHLTEI